MATSSGKGRCGTSGTRRRDTERFAACFRHLLAAGIYVVPSQFEALFVSTAHGEAEIDATVEAAREFFGR